MRSINAGTVLALAAALAGTACGDLPPVGPAATSVELRLVAPDTFFIQEVAEIRVDVVDPTGRVITDPVVAWFLYDPQLRIVEEDGTRLLVMGLEQGQASLRVTLLDRRFHADPLYFRVDVEHRP